MPNVETALRDDVTLQVDCLDRLYLNGYVPALQRPEQLWRRGGQRKNSRSQTLRIPPPRDHV